MGNVEREVDLLLGKEDRVLKAVVIGMNKPTRYHMKKSKHLLKGSGLLVLLISGLLVSGSLFVLYGIYTGTQEGDLELTGVTSDLSFDGESMTSECFSVPMDVTSMNAGDSFVFEHSVMATDGCDWELTFDASDVVGFPVETEFFGFYFDILDDESVSIIDGNTLVRAGHPVTLIDFSYNLDPLFLDTVNSLPYSVDVILTQHVDVAPVAVDDEATMVHDGYEDVFVLDNDFDFEGGDLEIIDVEVVASVATEIAGTYPNQYIILHTGGIGTFEIDYTIEDDTGLTDIGTVFLTST